MVRKTRHSILYSTAYNRNDGSPLYYFNQLRKLPDTEVLHLTPEHDLRGFGKFDYTWVVDWGEDALLGREKALALPMPPHAGKTIYIASDTHLDDGYRYNKALQFDYVFFNQLHALDEYKRILRGVNVTDKKVVVLTPEGTKPRKQLVHYLPHAAEPQAYPHFNTLKKYDLCFIGHMQEYHKGNGINLPRIDVLDYMFRKFPNFYFGSRNGAFPEKNMFEDAAKRFCESRIVFNISVGNDANMRFFETLITGSFLLTNRIPELKNLEAYGFKDGIHYAAYETLEDAEEIAKYYIDHEDEREVIAKRGYEQALKTGTYKSRIEEVLKIVSGGDINGI